MTDATSNANRHARRVADFLLEEKRQDRPILENRNSLNRLEQMLHDYEAAVTREMLESMSD